jgi:hypothetical protein
VSSGWTTPSATVCTQPTPDAASSVATATAIRPLPCTTTTARSRSRPIAECCRPARNIHIVRSAVSRAR